uniref:Uncharacterized protein n=1 Tax=Pseudomonas putida TaxID=303 RepID=A0A223Q4H2_PSEPU|nr:Hypothetical protein [Pseudomonas putida]
MLQCREFASKDVQRQIADQTVNESQNPVANVVTRGRWRVFVVAMDFGGYSNGVSCIVESKV